MDSNPYERIDARPVKRFFVEMLTRDIQIEDAILDLLDNCVDGVMRSQPQLAQSDILETETPYSGFGAKITFNKDHFQIEDNCGGIPWSEHARAFRMGRPISEEQLNPPMSVGVYGIGLKRAIFKFGGEALIYTQNSNDNYVVLFTKDWMESENSWDLAVEPNKNRNQEDGTQILIQNLHSDIQARFNNSSFEGDLIKKIASHYAVIIRKGFKVQVNDQIVEANPIVVRFDINSKVKDVVRPYIFRTKLDDVEVFVAVGLREPIPGFDRISNEQDSVKFSSDYAGWTIICNDRVVLYCDRSEMTGWGLFGIPRYHTQFIAISGVVEFRGDPAKLPTTTTKRGLKFESTLYQQVLDRMREGMKLFTDFTNKWKTMESEAEQLVGPIPSLPYSKIKTEAQNLEFNPTRRGIVGEQYIPKLPMPENVSTDIRISYMRERDKVKQLAEQLFSNSELEEIREHDLPRRVGEGSFDYAYKTLLND